MILRILLQLAAIGSTQGFAGPICRSKQTKFSRDVREQAHANMALSEKLSGREEFLKGLSVVGSAAMLASCLSRPQDAMAIGQLPEFLQDLRFTQHLAMNVPDIDAAVSFYKNGLDMQILRTRLMSGNVNSTFMGYGPETLTERPDFYPGVSSFAKYGAHFSLELNEVKPNQRGEAAVLDPGNQVAYLHIAVPSLRISKLIQSGGDVRSGYGWVSVDAPNGLRHQVVVGTRRDPIMFLALNTQDMQRSLKWYKEVLGMRELEYPLSRDPSSVYEPKQPKGSKFLGYNPDGFGILLLPSQRGQTIRPGGVVDKIAILDTKVVEQGEAIKAKFAGEAPGLGTRVAVTSDPDGLGVALVEYDDLEKELPR